MRYRAGDSSPLPYAPVQKAALLDFQEALTRRGEAMRKRPDATISELAEVYDLQTEAWALLRAYWLRDRADRLRDGRSA